MNDELNLDEPFIREASVPYAPLPAHWPPRLKQKKAENVVPFGKYKDRPVDAMMEDQKYLQWLLAQPWFSDNYPQIYTIVVNQGVEPVDSPEHNAMQAKFLELELCEKVVAAYFPTPDEWLAVSRKWADAACPKQANLERIGEVFFEKDNIDVSFHFHTHRRRSVYKGQEFDEYAYNYAQFYLELKPTMGDDYPSVLRQMQRYQSQKPGGFWVLVIGAYTGTSVTHDQVLRIFAMSKIKVLTMPDISNSDFTPHAERIAQLESGLT
jgi:hypothetical protein